MRLLRRPPPRAQEASGGDAAKKGERKKGDEPSWQFGWVNVLIIFGIGALGCIKLGFFDGDNVPDFVAKRDDLQYYFKSLAAPEPTNETAEGDAADARDPFAAPEEEGTRF